MMPPQTRTPPAPYLSLNDVRGMIAASPLSPDEYAMRIATQTESALICKRVLVSIHCLSIPVFPAPQRTSSSRWSGVKGTHRTGRRANRPPPCSLQATVKRDIGHPVACVVCLAISPAVCRLFLLACKTMYRSSVGVVPRGRPLSNSWI
ncbi:uncharacterized protein TNCV_104261 [Trichonephila clavipes]|nr:uncharacterized protein TNCV_104261 [Trichonephila clavipes]